MSFLDALYDKYCDENDQINQVQLSCRVLEFVGLDRLKSIIKNVKSLRNISLYDYRISKCEIINDEQFSLDKLVLLDLTCNLIPDWTVVANIVSLCKCLQHLTLQSNPLKVPSQQEIDSIDKHVFESLKCIVLSKLNYTWSDVLQCSQLWPKVQELYLQSNRISSLSPVDQSLPYLKFLSLIGNPILKWSEVCKLSTLKW